MSAEFDPYYELLGIDKQQRPPDHYALLGLQPFESDPKKIDEAATERMSRMQDLANSDYVDHSQRLLNELSAARRCLLNQVQKVAYDENLRTKQQRARAAGPKGSTAAKSARSKKQLIIIGVALLLLLSFAILKRGGNAFVPAGNLIVEWPITERNGGTLLIDSKLQPLPTSDPMRIMVAEGRHTVVFRRPGYRNISQSIEFTSTPVRLQLRWIPIGK